MLGSFAMTNGGFNADLPFGGEQGAAVMIAEFWKDIHSSGGGHTTSQIKLGASVIRLNLYQITDDHDDYAGRDLQQQHMMPLTAPAMGLTLNKLLRKREVGKGLRKKAVCHSR